ncbi:hypothetical protein [Methylobacterium sp. J-092]|uniref:hypothetical protein n=1 Tax=Methylobacterium sp. J-092 TaxID=2836667 RepID=UPI001FBBD1BC|nr:hypothetical protein [Methylobacterium sp. J-092]MCJ2007965.1 hypothetical protein [Methylobacterium sp. J-092]
MAIQSIPTLVEENSLVPQLPALMLFGRNRGGKPCAAWFDSNQAEAATAAAVTMKLRMLPIAGDDQRALALQLAHGRILPSGKVHVPGARRDLYGRLVLLAGESAGLSITEHPEERNEPVRMTAAETVIGGNVPSETSMPSEQTRGAAVPVGFAGAKGATDGPATPKIGDHNFVGNSVPRDRDEIGLGSIVLAHEGPEYGWWEAEIIGMNGRVFSMRWRDFPEQGTFLRQPGELALMPPGNE